MVVGYTGRDVLAPDPPAAVDAEGVTEPLAPVAVPRRVNGILLGVPLQVLVALTNCYLRRKKNALSKKKK